MSDELAEPLDQSTAPDGSVGASHGPNMVGMPFVPLADPIFEPETVARTAAHTALTRARRSVGGGRVARPGYASRSIA
jgi:hypothetical protein